MIKTIIKLIIIYFSVTYKYMINIKKKIEIYLKYKIKIELYNRSWLVVTQCNIF
jgi:hypothetical protein